MLRSLGGGRETYKICVARLFLSFTSQLTNHERSIDQVSIQKKELVESAKCNLTRDFGVINEN
jgi:hypothetical protein